MAAGKSADDGRQTGETLEGAAGPTDIAYLEAHFTWEADLRVQDQRMHVVVVQLVLASRVIQ